MSLGALWSFRSHLQDSSRLATANYPETLHAIAVVNSPSFFPTVWGWIKVRLSLSLITCSQHFCLGLV